MTHNAAYTLSGLKIHTTGGVLNDGAVTIRDGVIERLEPAASTHEENILVFPPSYHLIPGFIDMHTHGANGYDVMDGSLEALATICQTLAKEGTTSFLATTMTASPDVIEKALITVRDYLKKPEVGAEIIGVHLEGPFIAPAKMGAQNKENIISPSVSLVKHWQEVSDDSIKLVTLAPELANSEALINYLHSNNVIASFGHTNANYYEAMSAIKLGCTHATHLFNAMRGMHHREPGAVTAALMSDNVMVELILDGLHLHPAIVEMVLKLKGAERIVLITDAMRAKCLSDGCYDLGGQDVHVKEGLAQLADGTLAGSVLDMMSAVQNMMAYTGCELDDVIKMTSENPARALKIFDHKGSIAVGKDADLVVLNEDYNVVMTMCRGRVAYSRESTTA